MRAKPGPGAKARPGLFRDVSPPSCLGPLAFRDSPRDLFAAPTAMLPAVQPSDLLTPEDYLRLIRIAHGDDSARAKAGDGSYWVARPPITDLTRRPERPIRP